MFFSLLLDKDSEAYLFKAFKENGFGQLPVTSGRIAKLKREHWKVLKI